MSKLQLLGPAGEPSDGIEDAEFEEVDTERMTSRPVKPSRPPDYTISEWLAEMSDLKKLVLAGMISGLGLFYLFLGLPHFARPSPVAADEPPAQAFSASTADGAGQTGSTNGAAAPMPLDFAQLVDPSLSPGSKFQIDSDSEALAGTDHRCNRRATFQYYFNQDLPGTFIGWFNDPDSPSAVAESGTFRVEAGQLYLHTTKATKVITGDDGSTNETPVPDTELPIEKNAPIAIDADGKIDLGGMKFRRCNGYL